MDKSTSEYDQQLAYDVKKTSAAFCHALDAAGNAGLQIDVKFGPTARTDGGGEPPRVTGWQSYTKLSRVLS